jgi:sulfur carrier protein
MTPVRLIIGNQTTEVVAHNVNDLVTTLGLPPEGRGIAIAVNDVVVSRSRWKEHELCEGDRVEIVRAVQGG